MCSQMVACALIPGFPLGAALESRPSLALRPAALPPVEGPERLTGPVTAVAEAAGVRRGMRMGEALATCPSLVIVEQDPARAEQAWEEILRRLEDAGFAVEPAEPGCVYFETSGIERLYGGLERALPRALAALRSAWGPRVGAAGRRLAALAGGRRPPAEIAEALEFPEAIDNELTLRRALGALVDTLLGRPERAGRFARKLALTARLVGGGSWRRTVTLRDPTVEAPRLRAALGPKLAELPGPVVELGLELVELTESTGRQLELVPPEGADLVERLHDGLRQVRAATGTGSVCTVVEVAPWSRIPEARALLVPRDE